MTKKTKLISGRRGIGTSQWLPQKIKENYLQQGKKILLIGDRGCGKTTFIKERVIPNIQHSYKAIDFCGEYDSIPANHVIRMSDDCSIVDLKNKLIDISKNTPDDTAIIADSLMCMGGIGFGGWFEEAFKEKTLIAVMHEVRHMRRLQFPYLMFDAFVIFNTRDSEEEMIDFIEENLSKGKFTSLMSIGSSKYF